MRMVLSPMSTSHRPRSASSTSRAGSEEEVRSDVPRSNHSGEAPAPAQSHPPRADGICIGSRGLPLPLFAEACSRACSSTRLRLPPKTQNVQQRQAASSAVQCLVANLALHQSGQLDAVVHNVANSCGATATAACCIKIILFCRRFGGMSTLAYLKLPVAKHNYRPKVYR